jgi:hypothetical protein
MDPVTFPLNATLAVILEERILVAMIRGLNTCVLPETVSPDIVVPAIVEGEANPIGVPSIAPPFTSIFENVLVPVDVTFPVKLPENPEAKQEEKIY